MILTADNLSCRRGGRLIFRDVSFRVSAGEALVVTGDNGAGKSTLIALIAGLLTPASGAIRLVGAPGGRELREMIGLMGHRDGLKPSLSVRENLDCARRLLGDSAIGAPEALERVGLVHALDMPVEHLSAGQRRRVSLARLLCCDRPLWLMDEPAGALDFRSLQALTRLMQDHLNAGGMIIAATHQDLGLKDALTLRLEPASDPDAPEAFWEDDDADDERLMGLSPAGTGR